MTTTPTCMPPLSSFFSLLSSGCLSSTHTTTIPVSAAHSPSHDAPAHHASRSCSCTISSSSDIPEHQLSTSAPPYQHLCTLHLCTSISAPLHLLCTSSTPLHLSSTSALHHLCLLAVSTALHHLCTFAPLHHLCSMTSAPPLRHLCATFAPLHLFTLLLWHLLCNASAP